MRKVSLLGTIALGLVLAVAVSPGAACAAEPEVAAIDGLAEIIVTAQKRAQDIQSVPLSIQAVSGEDLATAGITTPAQLGKLVPSLQINTPGMIAAGVVIRIRGFGTPPDNSTDADVASYIDGVFIPRPGAILSSFLDVSSVEVLNGPQGTLFGRNAAMGAISINTNEPTRDPSLDISAEAGSYGGPGTKLPFGLR